MFNTLVNNFSHYFYQSIAALAIVCALAAPTQSQNFVQAFKGVANDRFASDQVGNSVSISGTFAVIGAQLEDQDENNANSMDNSGAAYIFKKQNDGTWVLHQKIAAPPPNRAPGAQFGSAVSISGDYLIVGAALDNSNKGAAYIFEFDTGTDKWSLKERVTASDGVSTDLFGFSVGISSDGYAVVGAYRHDDGGGDTGAAYIFERNPSTTVWEENNKIGASDKTSGDNFGYSVAIHKERLIVGAPFKGGGLGSAYIFERLGGGGWDEKANITALAGDQDSNDQFGFSVAIDDDIAVVGAHNDDQDAIGGNLLDNAGAAYVFKRGTGGIWNYEVKIVAKERKVQDNFGCAVGVSGNNVIVGARGEDYDPNNQSDLNDAGAAYIFHLDAAGTWVQTKKIVATDRQAAATFGNSVAIDDDHAIVGAPTETKDANGNTPITEAGAAYIFQNNATFNGGLSFDGLNDHIELPNEANFDFTNELTIECWVKLNNLLTTGDTKGIITKGDDAWELNLKEDGGSVRAAFLYQGGELTASSAVDFNDGKWHHVALVFDGRQAFIKNIKLYIDGIPDNSVTFSSNINTNDDPVWIGGNTDKVPTAFLNGSISEVRVWKAVRSATDISNFKDCKLVSPLPPCLTAYYKLNDGLPYGNNATVAQVNDATGNNHGTPSSSGLMSNFIDADRANQRTNECSAISPAALEVLGNGVAISNGGSISSANNTRVGPIPANQTFTLAYTIKNTGTGTLNISGVLSENNDDYVLTTPTITSLNPNDLTTFTLSLNGPPGIKDNNITILTNDCNQSTFVFPLQVTVSELPEIDIQNSGASVASGNSIDFGAQAVNKTSSKTLAILNTSSNVSLTLQGNPVVDISDNSHFTVTNQPTVGSTIGALGNTTFTVEYTPTSVGTHTATLTIQNNDFDEGTYTIILTGQGAEPEINVQDQFSTDKPNNSTVNMGNYTLGNDALQQTLTIQNTGPVPLTLTEQPTISSGNTNFSISTPLTNLEVPAGDAVTIQVNFRPTTTGNKTGTLTIRSNDSDESTYTINLTGTAAAPASSEIAVLYDGKEILSGDTIKMDTTAALNVRSIELYIKNQGQANLTLNGNPLASLGGTDANEFNLDLSTTVSTINGEDSTLIKVNFAPVSTSLGAKTAQITISNNDSDEATYTIRLESVSVKPPSSPTDVNITPVILPATTTNTTRNALTITWATPSDISNVQGFRIKRSDGNTDNFQEIADISDLTATTHQDSDLEEGVQYYYRVFSYNKFGESEPGELQSLVYVGTPEAQQIASQTVVYPNPANDQVRIILPLNQPKSMVATLYNVTGQRIKTKTFAAGTVPTLSVKGLPTGKYMLQIKLGTMLIYKPLIKQ
ncbi:choice-of-anchor D domain-containing protein [Microscilla marina]|uniref:Fibronectin type III domain protein n=1 Tax=Microscilla marina ATCC 23134 TaxID=313606 RepID=A1ZSM9_MICM2|nr:choice-of-anchor D domain-containing protein [Microscilla marina]EAY26609.1 fibronectin type III domain protein [Microscilla marina ATCC 23134]